MECESANAKLEDKKSKLQRQVEDLKKDFTRLREDHERMGLDHKREVSQQQTKHDEELRGTKAEVKKRVGQDLGKDFEHRHRLTLPFPSPM